MLVCPSFVFLYISGSSDAGYLVSEGVKPCIYFTRYTLVIQRFPSIYGDFQERNYPFSKHYLDYDNPAVQSYDNYLIARKYNKKIFVMEPIKGGSLLRLPEEALTFFTKKDYNDLANIALRFVCSFDGIDLILSGMSNTDMVINNAKCLEEHRPLSDQEFEITNKVREIINSKNAIQCTSCHYCTEGCPMNIYIPELIAAYNSKVLFKGWNSKLYYESLIKKGGKPSDCIKCGLCEKRCPQHLKIRNIITNISQSFEKKKKNPVNRIPIS